MRYVYVIGNRINWKVYVGQTKDYISRKKGHWYGGTHNARGHLYDSMRKYGIENFEFRTLEECEDNVVDERETFWIAHYNSCDHTRGYNCESGGHKNKTLSEETKKKLSEANKGVPFTPERCANMSKSRLGKPNYKNRKENNPERGKAISERLKGKPLSEAHKLATSEGLKRYMASRGEWHPSDEARHRMSEAQKIAHSKRRMLIDVSHPDAQPKQCHQCNETFVTKGLLPFQVQRHKAKQFCTRACVMTHENLHRNSSIERREKIASSKRGTKLSDAHKLKIKMSMLQRNHV